MLLAFADGAALRTSGPPEGTAALVWQSSTGTLLPADNIDPKACSVLGGTIAGTLYGNGKTLHVAFTTAGGQPTNGQTVWLASSQDDTNTGRGKATATLPSTTTPPPVYPQIFGQNIVPIGTCADNSNYGVDGTCVVRLQVPAHPTGNVPAADQTFAGAAIKSLSVANNFQSPGNSTELGAQAGQTLIVVFSVDGTTAYSGLNVMWANTNFTNGWRIGMLGGQLLFQYEANSPGYVAMPVPQPGLHCLIVSIPADGLSIRATFDGVLYTAAISTAIPAPAFDWVHYLGGGYPTFDGWDVGGIYGAAVLNYAMSDVAAQALTAPWALTGFTPSNRLALPASVVADAGLMWQAAPATWSGTGNFSATAGPAGSGFTMTKHGSPTKVSEQDDWVRGLAPYYLDGVATYDSRTYPKTGASSRIAFSAPTKADVWRTVVGVETDDFDNNDNAAVAVIVNGSPVASVLTEHPDGVVRYTSLAGLDLSGTSAPYLMELVTPDRISKIDTYEYGTIITDVVVSSAVTFQTSTTSKRLLVIGDGQTLGGHDAEILTGCPSAGSVVTRMRVDYPGRITGAIPTVGGITPILDWGNGSMAPYARYLVEKLLPEGSPTTTEIFVQLGVEDYYFNRIAPAPFGVHLGEFIDELHAQAPSSPLTLAPPMQHTYYDVTSPGGGGHTLQEYVDVVNALATGREWLTVVDTTGPNTVTFGIGTATVCPSGPDGQIALTANMKAALGY